jgi:hypothetical protein
MLAGIGAVAVLGAALVLVWSAAVTSNARITAMTSGTGFFSAGTVTLERPTSSAPLLFDADLLYPGRVVVGCVVIDYQGSLPASVRLHAQRTDGSGLDEYMELRLHRLDRVSCPTDDSAPVEADELEEFYAGRMAGLWVRYPDYGSGFVIDPAATTGTRIVLMAETWVVADDQAQGLTSEFNLVVEARP